MLLPFNDLLLVYDLNDKDIESSPIYRFCDYPEPRRESRSRLL